MNNEIVRCSLIGTGAMGKKYAQMLGNGIEGLALTAVCCRSDDSFNWAKAALADSVKIVRSEDELYKNSTLFDAVIIVTPHKLHPHMAIRAFGAGKHVLCDKPAGVTAVDAEAMAGAAKAAKMVYAMMCHQRAYKKYIAVKGLLSRGEIGEVQRVSMINTNFLRTRTYHRSGSWRSSWIGEGGGALINQGYHLIDMWQYLFGVPEYLYAEIPFGKYNDFAVDDEATIVMRYPRGVTGTFVLTTGEGAPRERLEIAGTQGAVLLEGDNLTITRFGEDVREYIATAQVTSGQELAVTQQSFDLHDENNAYEVMFGNFARSVLRGEQPIADGAESCAALQIINAAYLSAWEGRRVKLPVDGELYSKALRAAELAEGNSKNGG